MAELERENLNARAQYERDQLMLEQYDRRMKDLETQLNQLNNNFHQQNTSKDDQIRALQDQVNTWRSKYEALAKLYSQLRHEHLELLQKFKSVQLKAASAQEAIDKREKLEREIKTKNLELADMIRERDRALHEKDRITGGNREELEKLKRELRFALEKADNADRAKGSELSSMLAKYNREMADLEETLRVSQIFTWQRGLLNSSRIKLVLWKTFARSTESAMAILSVLYAKRKKSWKSTSPEWIKRYWSSTS